ncbi:MAG: hypothetical protein AAB539_02275 [Patescibacteria group bacterium]
MVLLVVGLLGSAPANANQMLNTLLECGLQGYEADRLTEYTFQIDDSGALLGKVTSDDGRAGDVNSVTFSDNGDELRFNVAMDSDVVSYALFRNGMKWEGSGRATHLTTTAEVYLGKTCMLPLAAYRPKKMASL